MGNLLSKIAYLLLMTKAYSLPPMVTSDELDLPNTQTVKMANSKIKPIHLRTKNLISHAQKG